MSYSWCGGNKFHVLRRYPAWAGRLPAHAPCLAPLHPLPDNIERMDEKERDKTVLQ